MTQTVVKPRYTAIPKAQYDGLMKEIDAMKPSKRKNWKSYLTDKWGTKSKCLYRDGKIYNWSLITKKWQEVLVVESVLENPKAKATDSRLGQMLKAGIPCEVAFAMEMAMNGA